jgi:superfamily I DNA and/or RNA helicase
MNTDNYLILVKGEDKTAEIKSWKKTDRRIVITYQNGRPYQYGYNNVKFFKNPTIMTAKDCAVLKSGVPVSGIGRVLDFNQYVRIEYKTGYKETFSSSIIQILHSSLAKPKCNNNFNYLKEIARAVSLKTEDGNNILGNQYGRIDFVREDSALNSYLSGKLPDSHSLQSTAIYPFGFNISQKTAVEQAMNQSFSVIEGPPGTGKTQTILNIIANAVMNDESVAVVSSNNSATANVLEKLKKNHVDFIAAYLGSVKNKDAFIESQTGILPDMAEWHLSNEQHTQIKWRSGNLRTELDSMLQVKNELSAIKQKLDSIILESKHFHQYLLESHKNMEIKSINRLKAKAALSLWAECEKDIERQKTSLFKKIINLFRYGIIDFSLYKLPIEECIMLCQKQYYIAAIRETEKQKDILETKLKVYSFDEKMKEYSSLSTQLFKHKLSQKYNSSARRIFKSDDLWKRSDEFILEYPVVLSTTYSLRSSLSYQHVYDYVIVDEASQVNIATGALALSCAKKAVIVGDLKQLPNVVDRFDRESTEKIFNRYLLPESYCYASHSLLSSVTGLFPNVSRTLLREHYRCHPKIIEFCNKKFYHNQLIVLTEPKSDRKPLMVYQTVKGNHARGHLNQREIDVITNEVIQEQKIITEDESLGIVTPYDAQRNALQDLFKATKVKADSVDKFQGQERPIIIISTVDNQLSAFADDPNRLNVAISRAQHQLILVTNGNKSPQPTNTQDLINYIRYNNLEVIQSKTYSVFDNLFSVYTEKRKTILKKSKRVSKFDSENLMYKMIVDVLSSDELGKYGVACHVPLKMLIRDVSLLDDEEIKYAMNVLTHVDFLIFDTLGKSPVLAVEVDGVSFHQEGSRQSERDMMKNEIFGKYEIPYIRFRTDGSNERERLITALRTANQ